MRYLIGARIIFFAWFYVINLSSSSSSRTIWFVERERQLVCFASDFLDQLPQSGRLRNKFAFSFFISKIFKLELDEHLPVPMYSHITQNKTVLTVINLSSILCGTSDHTRKLLQTSTFKCEVVDLLSRNGKIFALKNFSQVELYKKTYKTIMAKNIRSKSHINAVIFYSCFRYRSYGWRVSFIKCRC